MVNRQKAIKAKGFDFGFGRQEDIQFDGSSPTPIDFGKISMGIKKLSDATLDLGEFKKVNPRLADKAVVLRAINNGDVDTMREISNFFYKTSGIYSRLCRYMAFMYRYDWMITPYINGGGGFDHDLSITSQVPDKKRDKIVDTFFTALKVFDDFEIKRNFGNIALKVIRFGCWYGYLVINPNGKLVIQQLPIGYCRSRAFYNGRPAVEFNMSYFDKVATDEEQRLRILNCFPKEFKKGYMAYKQGKLKGAPGEADGWYLLDVNFALKFNINGDDFPAFISVIPAIIDLDQAQDLDRKKMAQELLKIIIQKMPIDKNGDLIFDVDEAKELHNNAVQMLKRAIGVDVLTTFAEVEVADMSDKSTTTSKDDLEKVERTVYNEAGVSQLQFNSDGNIALNNSILNDEASIKDLVLQFESFLNSILDLLFNVKPKECYFKAQVLNTTIYNYKEMAKLYKEQTQLGYSKMLAQIALGQSQSSILANTYFENSLLNLVAVFLPPMSSNTMSADVLAALGGKMPQGTQAQPSTKDKSDDDNKGAGRPEKPDSEKTEKTIQNKESMS